MRNQNPHKFNLELFNSIKPSMRFDGDADEFTSWQNAAREKLNELLGLPYKKCDDDFKIEYEEKGEGYREIRFTFQTEKGYYVPCHLLIPDKCAKNKATVICLQGHSKGMHISLGRVKYEDNAETISGGRDFAVQAVNNGYYALTIEQRNMGECGGDENGPKCYVPSTLNLLIGRTTLGERVWDIQNAIDVLEKHFPKEMSEYIICMGNSGGGTTTFYASCLDERIKTSVPSCSVCEYEYSIAAMNHCICNFVPGIANYFNMGDLGGLIAPRNLVVVAGKEDPIFLIDGVKISYEMIEKLYSHTNGKCNLLIGSKGHQFYPKLAWPVINKLMEER